MQENANPTLENKVANYKLIARDSLRMNLINPRLTTLSMLENEVKDLNGAKDENALSIKVEEYEISKLDKDHPLYDKKLFKKEENLKYLNSRIKGFDSAILETEKAMDDQKKAIAMIESGETKVCLDDLNCLVDKMIKQDAMNQVPCLCK